jgi:integrase
MKVLPKRKHLRDRFGRIVRLASDLALEDLKQAIGTSHLGDHAIHLQATGRSATHIWETVRVIRRLAIACGFQYADDLDPSKLDRYLVGLIETNKSRRTRNGALKAIRSLIAWMIRSDRLAGRDPFRGISTVNEAADPRGRHRRALTPQEFAKLMMVTEKSVTPVESNSGPMRALLYILAAATGLRRKELASLTWAHLSLHGEPPYVHVPTASTKAKRDDQPIPLHPFVAKRLRDWLTANPSAKGKAIFNLTTDSGRLRKTSKMMRLDCEAAGIPYVGDIGVADFHSHRVAFVTALCRSCSDFSTVVDLARHRDPKLTAKVYDRVRLENRTTAIAALPMPSD